MGCAKEEKPCAAWCSVVQLLLWMMISLVPFCVSCAWGPLRTFGQFKDRRCDVIRSWWHVRFCAGRMCVVRLVCAEYQYVRAHVHRYLRGCAGRMCVVVSSVRGVSVCACARASISFWGAVCESGV